VSEEICLLLLNQQMPRALEIYGNARLEAKSCAVQTNSSNPSAMKQYGVASATARQFGVSGGFAGAQWSPEPHVGVDPTPDPFATLAPPTPGSCQTAVAGKINGGSATISPGTYCGGLDIGAGAVVDFEPGLYVFLDGPLKISSGAQIEGDGVTFGFVGADSVFMMQGNASARLTAPDTGPYAGVQMLSDRDLSASKHDEEWATIIGGGRLEYAGVLYLPEQQFWVSGSAQQAVVIGSASETVAVVDTLWAQGNAELVFEIDPDLPSTGIRPAKFVYGAALVR
jgi:hypothetical protein